ncbi:YitT family protein [Clostridioides mangenotii]|uniref:YitT family protein n=1 Tax=Metaclostridioides mangenotii TaxID=1540 RepID=UPI001C1269C0|nr:YitT family protein [Clostridioides mangenotii]MBU5306195.1 YitT family protein [Clostridioides mangenotii]MCR1954260.1 YitT family protein [Clostridioides mangenotii]
MEKRKLPILVEMTGLVLGCISMSIGINAFLKPHTIAPGGLSGLSLLLNKITGLPVSVVMMLIGVPLVMLAFRILGLKNSLKTLFGTVLFSAIVQLTDPLSRMNFTEDFLLSAISGGLLVGIGLGIMFKSDASTGGTDLIALILSKKFPGIKVTNFMSCLDGMIVIASGVVNRSIETALYSGMALLVIVKVADIIVEGVNSSRAFYIISEEPEKVRKAITGVLNRGLTILDGKGGYTKNSKEILFVVVSKKQELFLNRLVKDVDPEAFVIVSDVKEVYGKGFKVLG